MYEYQEWQRYFAQAAGGMEELVAEELRELGAGDCRSTYRGVYFTADTETLYRVNLCSRLATRILAPLLRFDCHSDRYLYKTAGRLDWSTFIQSGQTFAIFAHVHDSAIRHSRFAAQRLKDAIVDSFRAAGKDRPNVDTRNPDVWLNLHIENNKAIISVDTSGGSLHRRGYRRESVEAPMQETLAAAILRLSEWQGSPALYDPMCGSGTLVCEALMLQQGLPAALLRKRFGFENLPDFDAALWQKLRSGVLAGIAPPGGVHIAGSDKSAAAVAAARTNCAVLPGGGSLTIDTRDFREIDSLENRIIVCNPPYGIRLENRDAVAGLYKDFGDFLKRRCKGSTAFIYFGERKLLSHIGLRPAWKKPLVNGALDGRLAKFELY